MPAAKRHSATKGLESGGGSGAAWYTRELANYVLRQAEAKQDRLDRAPRRERLPRAVFLAWVDAVLVAAERICRESESTGPH